MSTGTVDITLSYPVKMAGAEVSVITMRRPKVRDMIVVSKSAATDVEREVRMFANLCQVEPSAIEDMDMADYLKLQEAYSGFLS